MIVQVKDLGRRADVNVVGTFKSVIEDIGAHKGVLICSSGFSKKAKTYARNRGITLLGLHDAQSRNWSHELTIPILWATLVPKIQPTFYLAGIPSGNWNFDLSNRTLCFSRDSGGTRHDIVQVFRDLWNSGAIPREAGNHTVPGDDGWAVPYSDESGNESWATVEDLTWNYTVTRRTWLGQYRPQDCRGIVDILNDDMFVPTYVKLSDLPTRRNDSWIEISDPEQVVLKTRGMIITADEFEIEGGGVDQMLLAEVPRTFG